jgi:hypothetical protein
MAKPPALALRGLKNPRLSASVSAVRITEQILREARIDERVAAALQEISLPLPDGLRTAVDNALTDQPAASWRAAIARIADQLLAAQGGPQERGT